MIGGLPLPRLVPLMLRLLPSSLLASLDAWSYRLARERAERRRNRG
jgi:hypothetical protein